MTHDVVFLIDVDNTLLDNDRIADDLRAHLTGNFGKAGELYWKHFEELRKELGYADYLGALQRYRAEWEAHQDEPGRLNGHVARPHQGFNMHVHVAATDEQGRAMLEAMSLQFLRRAVARGGASENRYIQRDKALLPVDNDDFKELLKQNGFPQPKAGG